ncbi:MAG: Holliday junction DNA helicase RuvB C-terminal domain-containing protein [Acidimicrobiales bacterium]
MTTLSDLFVDYRFFASREGDINLSRLKREFQFTEKWQVARLAMAVSITADERPKPAQDRDGSEIRGITLFKRDGTGPAFAALAVQRARLALDADAIAAELEAHWDRGMQHLVERLDTARAVGEGADALLVTLADESTLIPGGPSDQESLGIEAIEDRIVGQLAAKRLVVPIVRDALARTPPALAATLLFTGPASSGKTLFARTIADILRLPFVDTNGTVIRKVDELLSRIQTACADAGTTREQNGARGGIPIFSYPPAIVFVDECHALPRGAQTELLTATEPSQREAKTAEEIADLSQITFLLATTDPNRLLEPLRTRAREITLEPYMRGEVAEIVRRVHPRWPATVNQLLAVAGRLIPRQALTRAEDFERFLRQEHPSERASEQLALRFMRGLEMDELGLIPRDYRYLALLPADRSARGIQMIASQLHLEEAEVEESLEPFLLQLQLVERDPRGRKITDRGLELLRNYEARPTV